MIKNTKNAFTLIELLVVITIIGMLTIVTGSAYTSVMKSSRDARRQSDIEQIRSAIEQYRSNNNTYPISPTSLFVTCNNNAAIADATGTYLSATPKDPKGGNIAYYCSATANDYTIAAYLENSTSTCATPVLCGTLNCNYCLGPYGKK